MIDWERIKQFHYDFPKKVTCFYCNDVRYYQHNCFYEDICPACDSRSFHCRKVETVKRSEVPEGEEIRTAWA